MWIEGRLGKGYAELSQLRRFGDFPPTAAVLATLQMNGGLS